MWLTYAPIPNETATFYDISLNQVDMFSISYFIVSLLIGFIAIWLIEKAGLRFAVSHKYISTYCLVKFLRGLNIYWMYSTVKILMNHTTGNPLA